MLNTMLERQRVLVIDDDQDMVGLLRDVLHGAGFEVDGVACGREAFRALDEQPFSLILLDLRLDGEDGLGIARQLRERCSCPIIMISGASDETDRVLLLETAADDFLVKPFSARELIAHVRAVLRRYAGQPSAEVAPAPPSAGAANEVLHFGDWTLDLGQRQLIDRSGQLCALTPGEFRLLEAFLTHPLRVWSREELLEQTRTTDIDVFDRTIDVLILRLRRKIEPNPRHPIYITTERGRGYKFAADVRGARLARPS